MLALRKSVAGAMLATYSAATAQTPEQNLKLCLDAQIAKYQPVSDYSYPEFRCSVGNKKPLSSPPSKQDSGRVSYDGYRLQSALAVETFKISNGGHSQPFMLPDGRAATITYWCRAEDKDYGKSGKYNVRVYGKRQRLITQQELRVALNECSNRYSLYGDAQ